MKRRRVRSLSASLTLLSGTTTAAEAAVVLEPEAWLVGENIAEFVPVGYDKAFSPSLILIEEPERVGGLPKDWSLRPTFSAEGAKQVARISLGQNISLYGGGEVTGPLLRNGQCVKMWNTDAPAYRVDDGKRLYQTHPWVMGVREDGTSFGVIFDAFAKSELRTGQDEIVFLSEGAPFRVFILEEKTPQDVLRTLGRLTGTIEMPALWTLGYHQCRFSYFPESRVREVADTFRKKKIPCDVIWFDIDYMDGYRIFTIDAQKFPDPKRLNGYLHDSGYSVVYMIDPGVKVDPEYEVYKSGQEHDVYVRDAYRNEYHGNVWPGPCAFPDYTRPEVREWWSRLYPPFMSLGIDGIWNDMNEPTVFNAPGATMPESNIHLGGGKLPTGNHRLYHNAYGRLMVEASNQGIRQANPDKRPFILSRANLLGGQRFAAMWTGDNEATEEQMRLSIPMSITMGLSGQPFNGPDIGGFLGDTTGELFGQWMGFGAFMPFVRGHACDNTNDKEPWVFGTKIEREVKMALRRRYRLVPYYYTLFHRAHVEGLPVMQPVFFADIADPELRAEENAFLIGDDLLVVPSIAETPKLPKGIWRPLSLVRGDDKGKYQASLYVRGGAIIPLGRVVENLKEELFEPMTLAISLDENGHATGSLYWDAGEGWGFKNGEYAIVDFEATTGAKGKIKVGVKQREGSYPVNLEKVKYQILK